MGSSDCAETSFFIQAIAHAIVPVVVIVSPRRLEATRAIETIRHCIRLRICSGGSIPSNKGGGGGGGGRGRNHSHPKIRGQSQKKNLLRPSVRSKNNPLDPPVAMYALYRISVFSIITLMIIENRAL